PAPPADPFAADPFAADPFAADPFAGPPRGEPGWSELPVRRLAGHGPGAHRSPTLVRARWIPDRGAPRRRVLFDAPSAPAGEEFPVRVLSGDGLESLSLAIHTSVVRPGGADVEADGFPVLEEVRLLNREGAEPPAAESHQGARVELWLRVPPERIEAFRRVRADVARNAALRLRLALDAVGRDGRVLSPAPRTVTFTEPWAAR
ncbi:MAG: hypothetical protein D6731_04010, partial [Planctomycetota bacterium]